MNKHILLLSTAALTASLLSACSDDSSSGSNPATPPAESSSSAPAFTDISSSAIAPESSPSITSSSDITPASSAAIVTEITYDEFGFVDIQPVFLSIKPNEKAVFIVRHGERGEDTSKESPLTEDGVIQALSVGQKLISDEELTYISTNMVRTQSTCQNIALGRGQTTFPYDTSDYFSGSVFIKDNDKFKESNSISRSSKMTIAQWAYNGEYADAFYDIAETSEQVINEAFAKSKSRISIICSHDELLLPLIVHFSEGKADLRFFEPGKNRYWLNFLAGIAVIIDDQGNRRIYPIKGLDSAHEP